MIGRGVLAALEVLVARSDYAGPRWGRAKGMLLALILILFGLLSVKVLSAPPLAGFAPPRSSTIPMLSHPPVFQSRLVSRGKTQSVHSAAAVEISGGMLRAFWYGGSHEHAKDVVIYTAVFNPEEGRWSSEEALIRREDTQGQLHRYIKKLGNVVVLKDRQDQLWLFYVSVSVGRWSGSAINVATSQDDGESWSASRRLITSPFFNLATLVKGSPVLLEDGTIGLPVYHEFIGKFGEFVRLNGAGRVIQKTRLSWGRASLQPIIMPDADRKALGLMRHFGAAPRRILSVETTDGGFHWSRPVQTDLPNPGAAIAGTRLHNGDLLLVFNDSESARNDLSLAYRARGDNAWQVIHRFEKETTARGGRSHTFSYPYLVRTQNGDFHVLYTWHGTHIKHIQFNQAWLEQRLRSPSRL